MSLQLVKFSQLVSNYGRARARVLVQDLTRLGHGWYGVGVIDPVIRRALAVNARVGCMSAARLHGLWVPNDGVDHLATNRPLPALPNTIGHWVPRRGTQPVVGVNEALSQIVRWHRGLTAMICLESAIERGHINLAQARRIAGGHQAFRHLEEGAQSGTETKVRAFLQGLGYPVSSQVALPGIGRVDLVVGESLIIELDSRAHHTGEENYERDRRRDLSAVARGYRVLRLTYWQVFEDWEATKLLILDAIGARICS